MRKKNKTTAIRCTEEESRRIHETAKRYGLRLNDFVMRCALGKKIVVANGIRNRKVAESYWTQPQSDSYTCEYVQADSCEPPAAPR